MSSNYIPTNGGPQPPYNLAVLLTYAAAMVIDTSEAPIKQINLGGNLTLTTRGLSAGQRVDIVLVADASNRTLTLPSWKFVGTATPTYIPAGKTARITLIVNGTSDSQVTALYNVEPTAIATLTYATTVDIDCEKAANQFMAMTGNVTFTTSNKSAGKRIRVLLAADGSTRNFTAFPVGWTFMGAAPTTLAANKKAVLDLTFTTTADSGTYAIYSVQP